MVVFRYLIVIAFFVLCHDRMMGQQDTLRPATRVSSGLITLEDYTSSAVSSISLMDRSIQWQKTDGRKTIFNRQGSKFILPTLFITYGVSARFNQLPIHQFDMDINSEIRKHVNFKSRLDDYIEIGLPVAAYGMGFIPGMESRHNFRDRTLVMATSLIFMKGGVELLKHKVDVIRPDGTTRSFPSGHTAITMMSAHFMYKEYKETSPWIGVGGYMLATTTGVFRMLNNKHWFSDVVMGAGMGLLSVEVGYMMLPVWHSLFGIRSSGVCFVVVPTFETTNVGLGMVYRF